MNDKNIVNDIKSKANNNSDKEAYIHPSDYGYSRTSEGTHECIAYLNKLNWIENIKVEGKDLLIVKLFETLDEQ